MERRDRSATSERDRGAALRHKLGEVYTRHWGHVVRALYRFGIYRLADREDVAQDVFCAVLERLDEYDPERGEMEAWINGIAWHRASDFRKRLRHRVELPASDMPEQAAADADPERMTALSETRDVVLDVIDAAVDPDRQEIFALFELEAHTCQEIASALRLPITTVEGRLRLARKQFRAEVTRRQKARKLGPADVSAVPLPLGFEGNEHMRDAFPDLSPSNDAPQAAPALDTIADPGSMLPRNHLAAPAFKSTSLLLSGIFAGALGLYLAEHGAPSPVHARPLPEPVDSVTAVVVAPPPTVEIAPPVSTATEAATARAPAEQPGVPGRMDKEIVERMRQQDKADEREKLAERHRQAYGDSATAEERDAAHVEGQIASASLDASQVAIEAFRHKYAGSVHQPRLDGLLARKRSAEQAKGTQP